MQREGKEEDINFIRNIGVGKVLFDYNEIDIVKVLGLPLQEEFDKDIEIRRYKYLDKLINFHYENGNYDHMSIHLENINILNLNIKNLNPQELLSLLKKYCNGINLLYKYEYEETELDEFYYFEKLGLTVWFEGDVISDICIEKVDFKSSFQKY